MPMAHSKFVPYDMKKSVVKIYEYNDMNLSGIITNPYFDGELIFRSTTQLLKLLDKFHDEINYPEKSMEPRSFARDAKSLSELTHTQSAQKNRKTIASFEISILFRQNASWQGSLIWMERALSAEFRSVLELIYLIDSVLSDMTAPE